MENFGVMMRILDQLVLVDLDVTVTKLYTYISMFREILSDTEVIKYFQVKFGILPNTLITFPLLCIHLSILNPLTCRLPLRVSLIIAVRYSYSRSLTIIPAYSTDLIVECCKNITSPLSIRILGEDRLLAFTAGKVNKYSKGALVCLSQGNHYNSIVNLMNKYCSEELNYDSVDIDDMTREYIEIFVRSIRSFRKELYNLRIFCNKLITEPYSIEIRTFISMLCFYDRIDDIKYMISAGKITIQLIKDNFESLSSTKVFEWLHSCHKYTKDNIKRQLYPYNGTMVQSLKKLYKDAKYLSDGQVNDEVIIAAIMSDDIESLVWLGKKGAFYNKDYSYLQTSGITKEKLVEFTYRFTQEACLLC